MIGGEEYAVSLLKVKEIIEYDIVTEIPKTPHGSGASSTCAATSCL